MSQSEPVISIAVRRVAVLGGAYGNVAALRACLDDAERAGCGAVLFAGDALGFCGHAAETLALISARCAAIIAGNHEQAVAAGEAACRCGFADPVSERRSCAAAARQGEGLDAAARAELAALPERLVVSAPGGSRLLLCHGSPDRINEFVYAQTIAADPERARAWLSAHRRTR